MLNSEAPQSFARGELKKVKSVINTVAIWNCNIKSYKFSQILESFYGSKNLEVVQIIENKSSLKSNVIISIGELAKSVSFKSKKNLSPSKPPLFS